MLCELYRLRPCHTPVGCAFGGCYLAALVERDPGVDLDRRDSQKRQPPVPPAPSLPPENSEDPDPEKGSGRHI